MKLNKEWSEFDKQIKLLLEKGELINQSNPKIKTEDELAEFIEVCDNWNKQVYNYLRVSFENERNQFAHRFINSNDSTYNIRGIKSFELRTKEKKQNLVSRIGDLSYYHRIFQICDLVVDHEAVNLSLRQSYSSEDILELLLDKLYDLYDDSLYPIKVILEGNGIVLKRKREEFDYQQILSESGYISTNGLTNIANAQLTLNGKLLIEERRKIRTINYSKINENHNEIIKIIEELKERITVLGHGQEILFEELDDLKNLYPNLTKKNWGEILKGKLVDLGLAQILTKDNISEIYYELTSQVLMLP